MFQKWSFLEQQTKKKNQNQLQSLKFKDDETQFENVLLGHCRPNNVTGSKPRTLTVKYKITTMSQDRHQNFTQF